jgi:hypothetical protein
VLDPENLQDVATKNYVYSLDSAIQDSLMKRVTDANNKRIKNVADPVDDGDAVNKKHLDDILNAVIYQEVIPLNDPYWIRFFEMDLNLFQTVDSRVFLIKRTVKIKKNVSSKSTWIGNVSIKDKPTCPILLFVQHIDNHKTYDFLKHNTQKINRHNIIDQDKRLFMKI